jgi:hypothetical protein
MSKTKSITKPIQLILLVFGGIILILFSIISKNVFCWPTTVNDLLNSLGQALIIGPALSWILDLKSMVDYFKKITIESLISKEYLAKLERSQLLDLRKECTAKIHLKDAENIEKGLINLDESVCELLTEPYLERYRQNTSCSLDGDFFIKRHYMEEYVINPLDKKVKFKEFPKSYISVPIGEDATSFLTITKLTIKIDDGIEIDYTPKVKIHSSKVNDAEFLYNTVFSWVDETGKDLEIEYNKSLLVNRVYEIKTPKDDITFIKRVTLPTKSLKIDYSYNGSDLRLIGSCFGTLSYSNDNGMKVIQDDNYISIESFDWLLPGNGIFIVKTKK